MWAGLSRTGKDEENGNPTTIVEIGADGRGLLLGMNSTIRMPRGWTGDGAGHIGEVAKELRAAVYTGKGLLVHKEMYCSPRMEGRRVFLPSRGVELLRVVSLNDPGWWR